MGERVRNAIVAAILDHGPISFAEFMELALYGPGGYYDRPPVGGPGRSSSVQWGSEEAAPASLM